MPSGSCLPPKVQARPTRRLAEYGVHALGCVQAAVHRGRRRSSLSHHRQPVSPRLGPSSEGVWKAGSDIPTHKLHLHILLHAAT